MYRLWVTAAPKGESLTHLVAREAHRAGLKDDKQACETWWQHNGQQVSVGTLPCDKFYYHWMQENVCTYLMKTFIILIAWFSVCWVLPAFPTVDEQAKRANVPHLQMATKHFQYFCAQIIFCIVLFYRVVGSIALCKSNKIPAPFKRRHQFSKSCNSSKRNKMYLFVIVARHRLKATKVLWPHFASRGHTCARRRWGLCSRNKRPVTQCGTL